MIFLRPWYLLLLLIVLPLAFFIKKFGQNGSSWVKIVDKELLQFLSSKTNTKSKKQMFWINLLGLVFLVFAISGPSWVETQVPNYTEQNAVMIVLDLSTDSSAEDVDNFKFAIQDLINETKDLSLGLVVYSNEPFLVSPITEDKAVIANLLPQVNHSIMPANGNDVQKAKEYSLQKLKDAGFYDGEVLVLSNNEKADVPALINKLNLKTNNLKQSANKTTEWLDMGYYFLIFPALICLYSFRRGLFVFALLFSFNAQANIFENANQKGLRAFVEQDYLRAKELFKNKDWQASALYKSGDYKGAVGLFSDEYNLGNALAKSGDIEGAIKKYESVLEKEPNHEDAKFNLEYLKQQQNQQQQQNQDNNDNDDKKDNQEQNQQGGDQQNEQEQNQDDEQKDKNDNQNQGENDENKNEDNQDKNSQSDNKQSENSEDNQDNKNASQSNLDDTKKDDKGKQNAAEEQEVEAPVAPGKETDEKEGEEQEAYSEKAQALEQKFREIPEDNGGLLRAFIAKEYVKRMRGQ